MSKVERRFSAVGIGNAIMDLQVRIAEEEFAGLGLERGGMSLVDTKTQDELLRRFEQHPVKAASGGSATNTIISMAQLGAKVAYGCCVGEDPYGEYYMRELEDLGVVCEGMVVPGHPTGTCVILITPDAERTMNTHLGASAQFGPQHVSAEAISDSEWLYIEGYLFSTEAGQAAVRHALSIAKKNKVKVAVSFSDGFIVEAFRKPLTEAVEEASLIFANTSEAKHFASCSDPHHAFDLLCDRVPNVVMTMREKGARIYFDGENHIVDGFSVNALDETGAGDIFAGAFLYGVTQGASIKGAARLACFLASRVVTQLGPRLEADPRILVEEAGIDLYEE